MASENTSVELSDMPTLAITHVPATPHSQSLAGFLLDPLARVVASQLFPGNHGGIKYELLNDKVSRGEGDYEPMAADVCHHQIKSSVGSVVGLHVYPAARPPRQVVIFCHGNIRPSRYMNKFLEQLSNGRERVVVARDFVGYDLSSRVPNQHGSLERAAIANDQAVYDWVVREYPDAEIIAGGRSIGTMGWAYLLSQPKVKKAFGIVPFAHPAGVVGSLATPSSASWSPASHASIHIFGFSAAKAIDCFPPEQGHKEVLLLKAEKDELVPDGDAETLAGKLQRCSVKTRIITLVGKHNALPYTAQNASAGTELNAFLSPSS